MWSNSPSSKNQIIWLQPNNISLYNVSDYYINMKYTWKYYILLLWQRFNIKFVCNVDHCYEQNMTMFSLHNKKFIILRGNNINSFIMKIWVHTKVTVIYEITALYYTFAVTRKLISQTYVLIYISVIGNITSSLEKTYMVQVELSLEFICFRVVCYFFLL